MIASQKTNNIKKRSPLISITKRSPKISTFLPTSDRTQKTNNIKKENYMSYVEFKQ
ncbi:hypothetical protein HCU40_12405 [Pseudanabaena biceps]|nr:hypothetical protein [Pseudanabaena biceps]